MPQPKIIDWRDIGDENIIFKDPKKNSHHGLSVPVRWQCPDTNTEHNIIVQSPVMRCPWGVTDETGEYGRKVEVSMSFPGYNPAVHQTARGDSEVVPAWSVGSEGVEMQKFYDFISGWDHRNKSMAIKNGPKWFGKEISEVVIDELMKKNVKSSSEPDKYSPTFRVKVPVTGPKGSQVPSEEFYDSSGEKIGFDEMFRSARGSRVIALFKTSGLWFAGKSFGMNFQLIQMVRIENEKFVGCAISIPRAIAPAEAAPSAVCFIKPEPCGEADELTTPRDVKRQRIAAA